jgi:uncharacterized membrane protein
MTLLTLTTQVLANGNHWHHFWIWPLIPLAWLFVIFVAFRFFWGPRYWRGRHERPTDSALRILAERYARDEITLDEYRTRVAALTG